MQSELLDAQTRQTMDRWRQRREAAVAAAAPPASTGTVGVRLMLVIDVVDEDSQYGPHLVTVPVAVEGTPPVPRVLCGPVVRCYPMPTTSLDPFMTGEIVKVYSGTGASLAEKLVGAG